MSEAALVFGLHAVRTLLQQRPEQASLLILQKGRDDARVSEMVQAGSGGERENRMARRRGTGPAGRGRSSSGRLSAGAVRRRRWARARSMNCSIG